MSSRRSTFYLDNMAPQDSLLNRGPWLRLEELCRSVARVADEAYVVSGPLFLPEREKDGLRLRNRVLGSPPSVTWVPSHFFKVVLAERGGVLYIGCFVLPNGKCDDDLSRWLVPLENLEAGIRRHSLRRTSVAAMAWSLTPSTPLTTHRRRPQDWSRSPTR